MEKRIQKMITLSTFFLSFMMLLSSCNSVNPELYIDGTGYLYPYLQISYLLGGGHRPQTIYGKLVDQHGEPVPDVEVMFSYQYGSCFAFTNKKGEFDCRIGKNYNRKKGLYLDEINCCGYEWIRYSDADSRRIYDSSWVKTEEDRVKQHYERERFEEELQRMWYSTTRRKRHVVVLRKKETSSFLIAFGNRKMGLNSQRPDGYLNMATDIISYKDDKHTLTALYPTLLTDKIQSHDFHFHAEEDKAKGCWALTISVKGKNAGIQEWKGEKQYIAPAEGYEDKHTSVLKYGELRDYHFYAITRDNRLYSEFTMEAYAAPPQQKDGKEESWVNVHVKDGNFNPFGKRDMEMDDGYLRAGRGKLDSEISRIVLMGDLPDEEEYKKLRVFPDYRKIRHEWYESARKKKPWGWWLW